jgi:hypothetical protein
MYERLSGQAGDESWFPMESARLMSALGHLDLSYDSQSARPTAWSIGPTTLCEAANGTAFLCGARSSRLVDALADALDSAGGKLTVHSQADGPDLVRVEAEARMLDAVVTSLAEQGFALERSRGARSIARLLPPIWQVRAALPTPPMSWAGVEVERFALAENEWRRAAALDRPGAYRLLTYPVRFGVVVTRDGKEVLLSADSRLAKWVAAYSSGITLLAYDERSKTLSCPLGAQLPGLYERVAVLCSGKTPAGRGDGVVSYVDVPADVAGALAALLCPRAAG